jgi:hypothetical protein
MFQHLQHHDWPLVSQPFLTLTHPHSSSSNHSVLCLRGCGAFGGDFHLKFLQQVMAASLAGVPKLSYSTFKDNTMASEFGELLKGLQTVNPTVDQLHHILLSVWDSTATGGYQISKAPNWRLVLSYLLELK